MGNFFIYATNSCLERMLDCQKIYDYMQQNDWLPVKKIAKADMIIISTCSLTEEEDDNSIDYINYVKNKKSKDAKIIIAGCLPIIAPDKFKQLGEFTAISPTKLEALDNIIRPAFKFDQMKEPNNIMVKRFHKMIFKQTLIMKFKLKRFLKKRSSAENFAKGFVDSIKDSFQYCGLLKSYIDPFLVGKRSDFYYLRISKGCMGACSYCAKRFATGTLESKPLKNIIDEFSEGLKKGKKDFFLVTEDSGCYGMDIGITIVDLLKQLFKAGKGSDFKLVISNFNARWLVKYYKELEKIIIENQSKIYYFQIPIQSGSNRMLDLMNRKYKIEEIDECLSALRKNAPLVSITTDIIVGFPSETEDDFKLTKAFMERINFDFADIFPFQSRYNAPASKMDGCVNSKIVKDRIRELINLQNKKAKINTVFKKCAELICDYK